MKEENNAIKIIKNSSIFLLLLICNVIIISSLLFIVHISITKINLILAVLFSIIELLALTNKKVDRKIVLVSIIVAMLIFGVSILICSKTYDISWDGNTYHKTAIGSLKNGWNPIYESVEDYGMEQGNVIDVSEKQNNKTWVNHYAKGSWIFSASIYEYTNNIESSKIINLLMMYISFGILLGTFARSKLHVAWAIIISLIIVINPITVPQVFTYYIDGLLGLVLFILLASLIEITINKRGTIENFVILAASILVLANLKFTGLVYAGIFCCMFYIYWLYQSYKDGNLKQNFIRYSAFYIAIVIFSVCIVGYSPYIKNLIGNGHPFYPLFGENKVDIITHNEPKNFHDKGQIKKFAISILAEASNAHYNEYTNDKEKVKLKIPFTMDKDEIKLYSKVDLRFGGFGPLFSGILIISAVLTIYILIKLLRKEDKKYFIIYLLLLLGSAILILATEGSWWARYTPYLYLIPIYNLIYFAYLSQDKEKTNIVNRIISVLVTILLIINIGIIVMANMKNRTEQYEKIETAFNNFIKDSENANLIQIELKTEGHEGLKYNIYDLIGEKNIIYKEKIKEKTKSGYFFKYLVENNDRGENEV